MVVGPQNTASNVLQHVVRLRDILHHTLTQDESHPKVISFSVSGASGDYKIKFKSVKQVDIFIKSGVTTLLTRKKVFSLSYTMKFDK